MAVPKLFHTTGLVTISSLFSILILAYMGTEQQVRITRIKDVTGDPLGAIDNSTWGILQSEASENKVSPNDPGENLMAQESTPGNSFRTAKAKYHTSRVYPATLMYSDLWNTSAALQFGKSQRKANTRRLKGDNRKNILFIVSDDLRPQLNSYKSRFASASFEMHTPSLDQLAQRSMVMSNAFVQYSSCNPSRSSYMTSRRPDTTKIWDLHTFWRDNGGNFTTIPQFFKGKGYHTAGLGKIYHPGKGGGFGDPLSWTEMFFLPKHGPHWSAKATVPEFWRAINSSERIKNPLPDEEILIRAVKQLHKYTDDTHSESPFFLAVGFQKPHLPIVFPEEFLQYYPINDIPLPKCPFTPQNFPDKTFYPNLEVLICTDVSGLDGSYKSMNQTFPDEFTKVLRRAYFAGVSYIDYLVGILLDELQTLGLADSTIVSFIGDHGWHLGENALWGKHSNFDRGVQAPMMFHVPGKTDHGFVSHNIVEFIDLFPTLVDIAGYGQLPKCPKRSSDIELCTEGVSFASLLDNPQSTLKEAAFSQHRFPNNVMGYSVRTKRYRYTENVKILQTKDDNGLYRFQPVWSDVVGIQLYDHKKDPEENINVQLNKQYVSVCEELSTRLRTHFAGEVVNIAKPLFTPGTSNLKSL